MADSLVIECAALGKVYGPVTALAGLDLQVPKGSIYGFLGRNGAGKTTTIKILLGMAQPTAGWARVFDVAATDPASSVSIRRRTGFVSEDKDLFDHMTVAEIIAFTARCYPRWRTDLEQRYMRAFELPEAATVKALSRGTRTKLALLLACCRSAELLVLDEPTSGLDPVVAEEVLQLIVGHVAREETTVFLSSHQLAEVDQIADRIGVIHRGRMQLTGELDELRESFRRLHIVFPQEAPPVTFAAPGVVRVRRQGRVLSVTANGHAAAIGAEARALGAISVEVAAMPLKDMFLEIVAAED